MPIFNLPKFLRIGIKYADGRTREAAKSADAGAYVDLSYLHYELHNGNIRIMNNINSTIGLDNKVGYAFKVGANTVDPYFDAFSFGGRGEIEIWEGITITDEDIGTNIPVTPMQRGSSRDFDIFATKPTVPGDPPERNLVTKHSNAQIGNIVTAGATKFYSELIGEKGIPAAPSVNLPFELRQNTYYAIIITARENGINITANVIFNQECFG